MRVPISWLSTLVHLPDSIDDLARRLTMAGLEVEEVETVGGELAPFVVARVVEKGPHPDADRLSLCRVDDGIEIHQVVCGAPNVEAGRLYPFARLGTVIPSLGKKLKKAKIRGVASIGMLCSEFELGLSEEAEGLMELPDGLTVGDSLADALSLRDTVITIGITPNRPDCLGMIGVAREVGALTGAPLRMPPAGPLQEDGDIHARLRVHIEAPDGCPRYSARMVEGCQVGPSPDWMQQRLRAAGLRPICNIVDITNYVMLETGHPMHAFDERLVGGNVIRVRWAGPGETIRLLDGTEPPLSGEDLLIADETRGIALAGIMGGEDSGIAGDTDCVILEAAYFDPVAIRRSSRRLKVRSDSSYRFERGADPSDTLSILDRSAYLLQEHAGGRVVAGRIDAYPKPISPREISLRTSRVNRVLGTSLADGEVRQLVSAMGAEVKPIEEGTTLVRVPTFRPDIEGEWDLVEEVARLHGYDRIQARPLEGISLPVRQTSMEGLHQRVVEVLTGLGMSQAISTTFSSVQPGSRLTLANPLAEEAGSLRACLSTGLLASVERNLKVQNDPPWLFEIGRVFRDLDGGARNDGWEEAVPYQPYHLGLVLSGMTSLDWRQPGREVDFHTIKGVLAALGRGLGIELSLAPAPRKDERPTAAGGVLPVVEDEVHPRRRARVLWGEGERDLGWAGEASPDLPFLKRFPCPIVLAELDLEALAGIPVATPRFQAIPSYPRSARDLAVVLEDSLGCEQITREIRTAAGPLLEDVALFDEYRGEALGNGRRSLAFRLSFRHRDRTLKDKEVDSSMKRVMKRVKELGGELR